MEAPEGDHPLSGLKNKNLKDLHTLSLECLLDADRSNHPSSSETSDCTAIPLPRSADDDRDTTRCQLRRAQALATSNRPHEALELLRPVLAKYSQDADALCLQASCLMAVGSKAQALAAFAGALAANPNHSQALLGCAALHKDSGLLHESLGFLERVHSLVAAENVATSSVSGDANAAAAAGSSALLRQICHALAVVLTDLATHTKLAGGPGWRQMYERAATVAPGYSPVHYNLGVAAVEAGDDDEALAMYRRAVELEPRYAEAWCNMGVIFKGRGRLSEAIAAYEAALGAAPNQEVILSNLSAALTEQGTVLKAAGDVVGGVKAYERAIALRPRNAEALYNLGVAYTESGELDRAVFMYEMAITAAPGFAEAHNNLGVLHRERGNMEAAMWCYEAALAARPTFPQGLNNLAVTYTQQGRASDALNILHAALMSKPDYAEAYNNLGVLQRDVGDAAAAVDAYTRCCDLDPDNRNAGQNRLLALNYVSGGEEAAVCAAHAEWGARFQRLHTPLPPLSLAEVDPAPERPLRVGYLSPDLFLHSVSYFAEAPLRHHDPTRVRLIVYSVCQKPDAKTERLREAVTAAGGLWRDAARMPEEGLAEMVREDRVDILVELTGHTAHNRLGVAARRPAPIQVTWIGYPNSTGLTSIDYRLTDAICDPLTTRQTFTEQLICLPGCFLCYTPSPDAPSVAPLPALRNGFVTFGSFNALAKQTPEVLATWARLLRSLPGSRLVLKNKPFACEAVRQRYWAALEAEGVSRDRVDLLPLAVETRDHLAQYALVDVCLDPFPYAGTTTTAEALYMGVPCLTLRGGCHAHNVGVSLLTAVGLGADWVAHDTVEYVEKARELTADLAALSALRARLRARMEGSPLCDGPGFVEGLEGTYRGLWKRWIQQQMQQTGQASSAGETSGRCTISMK